MATEQLSTQSRHTWTPWLAVVLWTLISFSQLGAWLESSLIRHVLVQIPLLVLVGILLGDHYRIFIASWWQSWNGGGIAGILIRLHALVWFVLGCIHY